MPTQVFITHGAGSMNMSKVENRFLGYPKAQAAEPPKVTPDGPSLSGRKAQRKRSAEAAGFVDEPSGKGRTDAAMLSAKVAAAEFGQYEHTQALQQRKERISELEKMRDLAKEAKNVELLAEITGKLLELLYSPPPAAPDVQATLVKLCDSPPHTKAPEHDHDERELGVPLPTPKKDSEPRRLFSPRKSPRLDEGDVSEDEIDDEEDEDDGALDDDGELDFDDIEASPLPTPRKKTPSPKKTPTPKKTPASPKATKAPTHKTPSPRPSPRRKTPPPKPTTRWETDGWSAPQGTKRVSKPSLKRNRTLA